MSASEYLIDTNILIYHVNGSQVTINFITDLIVHGTFNISILTKIEFLGWDKHTQEGFEKCNQLLEFATVYPVDEAIADKAIELRKNKRIKLPDAVIAATALMNNFKLATRNIDDFKAIEDLEVANIFEHKK